MAEKQSAASQTAETIPAITNQMSSRRQKPSRLRKILWSVGAPIAAILIAFLVSGIILLLAGFNPLMPLRPYSKVLLAICASLPKCCCRPLH